MGKQHIIELNGKRYDALTGRMVTEHYAATKNSPKSPQKTAAINMDGFARRSAQPSTPVQHHRPVQKSQTLMRTTVQKPKTHKVHAVATMIHQKSSLKPAAHHSKINKVHVPKNPLIRKFSPSTYTIPKPSEAEQNNSLQKVPAASRARVAANVASVAISPLQQAIAHATSHQEPKIKRTKAHHRLAHKLHLRPKIVSGGALLLAFVLLGGFFTYQNVPNLRMRMAAQRAGVPGSLPSYQPPGFRMDTISHKPGEINISYKSNSDNRNFAVTQMASAWNSETLRDKLKANPETSNPVEVPDKGKTLFIYNDSNVTWVDGGIWYKVEGESELNSDQLLRLANSL